MFSALFLLNLRTGTGFLQDNLWDNPRLAVLALAIASDILVSANIVYCPEITKQTARKT